MGRVICVTNSYTSAIAYLIPRLWKLIKVEGWGVNGPPDAVNRGV